MSRVITLSVHECRHYRDLFRAARYAALADAEGFAQVCFALEALGLHLLGNRADLGKYEKEIFPYAARSLVMTSLAKDMPTRFKRFHALYEIVRLARNDNMHLGAYARHATAAAIELCIGLEEGLMMNGGKTVKDMMVKSPITVEDWQPVAHARQLMLMHSFSFLPVWHDKAWWLVSELGIAKFLAVNRDEKARRLGLSIDEASRYSVKLELVPGADRMLDSEKETDALLASVDVSTVGATLWLIADEKHDDRLAGVLSPFELM